MKCLDYANIFLVLSDENRLRIIQSLSESEKCACELLKEVDINQSTLSHHMKKLVNSNLVIQRREKKNIYYKVNMDEINKVKTFLNFIGSNSSPCKLEGK